jgi:hypothetical protein
MNSHAAIPNEVRKAQPRRIQPEVTETGSRHEQLVMLKASKLGVEV